MIEHLKEVQEILKENDGSLPDIEINEIKGEEVVRAYEIVRDASENLTSEECYYWSLRHNKDINIKYGDNPASLVISEEAEPFHVCFDGTVSPTGKKIPVLGVFVFHESFNIDIRMGPEWTLEAIEGLFELIKKITKNCSNYELKHSGNIFDEDGIFERVWEIYKDA
ncbi:hypothetical protein K6Q96_19125 [Grimontia kaedaensis]|uniref:Uncharacterized protein n=1 Tax=Grimontia kaedaensis TaxID=2872157 RepID=A0ABY4X288_9GAMM|nr:hypothetical protein [Grimontia kaedaensis]USH05323.1 hypothetical protein K6Q96_19125 [Grimontia kaedaensis]